MKIYHQIVIIILFSLITNSNKAQIITNIKDSDKELAAKIQMADKYRKGYILPQNFEKAFALYKECALAGSARAMNCLGLMYKDGLGVEKNGPIAVEWLEKAGKAGHVVSWFNLAEMYKFATGIPQDFVKAYYFYLKATNLGYHEAFYNVGYCLYKGLGVEQNYEKAFYVLKQGSDFGDYASMYLLGLCYRNGYGVGQDFEKARYWLIKSAEGHYNFAVEELQNPEPENSFQSRSNHLKDKNVINVRNLNNPNNKIKGVSLKADSVKGDWSGKLITYDWSGKYIIDETPIKITFFDAINHQFKGNWIINNKTTTLNGIITDTAIYYFKTEFRKDDHYNKNLKWEMQNGAFQAAQNNGKAYLVGNVEQYSPDMMEPGRPAYIILEKNESEKGKNNPKDTTLIAIESNQDKNMVDSFLQQPVENVKLSIENSIKKIIIPSQVKDTIIENSYSEKSVNVSVKDSVSKSDLTNADFPYNQVPLLQSNLKLYPNPFGNIITIQYIVNSECDVILYVYSSEGVLTIKNFIGHYLPGTYTSIFNKELPASGIYIFKLVCGREVFSAVAVKK